MKCIHDSFYKITETYKSTGEIKEVEAKCGECGKSSWKIAKLFLDRARDNIQIFKYEVSSVSLGDYHNEDSH